MWISSFLEGITPSDGCDDAIPKSKIYDATTNPKGLRCDLVDANVNQVGRDPKTGFAQRPLDNVGVQYGLEALNDKKITVDQFLDLNAKIGGFDIDGNPIPDREVATEPALELMYSKGRISEGGGDQKIVPIVDINAYDDFAGDIHDRFRAFSLRARLQSPNQVIWTRGGPKNLDVIGNIVSGGNGVGNSAISVVDRWLDSGTQPEGRGRQLPRRERHAHYGPEPLRHARTVPRQLPASRRSAHRGRGAAAQRHPEMPAAARRRRELQGHVHRGAAGAAWRRCSRTACATGRSPAWVRFRSRGRGCGTDHRAFPPWRAHANDGQQQDEQTARQCDPLNRNVRVVGARR